MHVPLSAVAHKSGSESHPTSVPITPQVIEAELCSTKRWELTTEGEEIAREGSHEARVFFSVPPEGLAQSELMVGAGQGLGRRGEGGCCTALTADSLPQRMPSGKVGFSKAMSSKWIRVDKSAADGPRVFRVVSPCRSAGGQVRWHMGPWPSQPWSPQVDSVEDEVQRRLQLVQRGQAEKLAEKERSELRKRKLLTEV